MEPKLRRNVMGKGGRVIYLADFRDKWTFFGLEGGR